jgi:hypothetical protein
VRHLPTIAFLVTMAAAQTSAPPAKPAPSKPATTAPSASAKPGAPKSPATAPDPDEGSLDNGIYTSDFFRFTYTLPEGFEVDEEFLADLEDQSKTTFVLLAAQGPLSGEDRRNVVVIMADTEATTADAYIAKVTRDYAQKQNFEVLRPAYEITVGGKPFYRADFRKEGTFQTAVFTVLKGYAVGFTMAAPNQEAMQALVDSLNSVQFLPAVPPKSAPPKTSTPSKPATPDTKKAPPPKAP